MTPFNAPVAFVPGAKSLQSRLPAEKTPSNSSAERFKDCLHHAVAKADRQEAQQADRVEETTQERALVADRSEEKRASADRVQEQQRSSQDSVPAETKSPAGQGSRASEEGGRVSRAETTGAVKVHPAETQADPQGGVAAPVQMGQQGVPLGWLQGQFALGFCGVVPEGGEIQMPVGRGQEQMEALLQGVLGARQGGGPMGEVKLAQVENLTLGTVAGPTGSSNVGDAGFKLPDGISLAAETAKISRDMSKSDNVPRLTLTATKPDFAQEMADNIGRLRMISRPGMPEQVRITLDPQDLGELHVRLQMDKNQQVHVTIMAGTDAARDLLTRDLPQLQQAFANNNLGFGGLTVNVGTQSHQGGGEGWRDGGREGHAGAQEEKEVKGLDPMAGRAGWRTSPEMGERALNLFA
ncbi:MAG: flagellar hook-length control protein FliK [Magnetococcales bacterium]|nr:flagellar hook-length control protein FliK [Magnetococcales bacterium]MBF0322826.1 flagellar hook-length control protein FliK [Magnetococcales bacterium]